MSKTRGITWVICLGFLLGRAWSRVVYPDLVVEDGFIFLKDALEMGYGSLLLPYAGSLHTLQRLIMLLALDVFSLAWLPSIICLVCLVITAGIASKIVSQDYAWLIPDWRVRFATALLLCSLPGFEEMAGSLAHLNWILVLYLVLLAFQEAPLKSHQYGLVIVVSVSIAMSILVLPLHIWRAWYRRHDLWALVILSTAVVYLILIRDPNWSAPLVVSTSSADLFLSVFLRSFSLLPWIGNEGTRLLSDHHLKFWRGLVQIATAWVALGWISTNRKSPKAQGMTLLVLGIAAWVPLNWLSRPNSFTAPLWASSDHIIHSHFSFPLAFASLLFWVVLLNRSRWIVLFLGLNMLFALLRFHIAPFGETPKWPLFSQNLAQSVKTGCPNQVLVRVQPGDQHNFIYHSKKKRVC